MSNIWERFDNIASVEDVVDAKAQLQPLEEGTYEAVLELIEPSETKDGLPMLKARFRLLNGKLAFYNQNLQNINYPNLTAKNIAEAIDFLNGITGDDIIFEGIGKLAEVVTSIETGNTYVIEVSYAPKDIEKKWAKIKVVGESKEDFGSEEEDDDLPF